MIKSLLLYGVAKITVFLYYSTMGGKKQAKTKITEKRPEKKAKLKVYVGLSGGVDSAVSAALLKRQGYDVTGVFIKAWTPPNYPCTWKEDRRSAMRAAAVLNIPFFTLDLEKEYKRGVADYMIEEYRRGRTPNPDVMCNKEIKFGAFLNWALSRGADFVATGHYAIRYENYAKSTKQYELKEAKDKNKDQSYFLWTLTPEQLKHILFPVGDLEKPDVRKLASKFGLPQATRKDSQGLCFLGRVDMKEFLSQYIPSEKGDVLDAETGEVIGHHPGALFFTLGERHGFTVTKKTDQEVPLYVVGKNIEKNMITVSSRKSQVESPKTNIILEDVNWVAGREPEKFGIECRFRYRQDKLKCEMKKKDGNYNLEIGNLNELPASGQSIVFYAGEICLGGGIIK
jgi:tRNA-specific 2-thiouridylase